MITPFITEANFMHVRNASEWHDVSAVLNQQKFRVSDTALSYRQVNYLDKSGLLDALGRESTVGWRKFSTKEMAFLLLITELKRYGYTKDTLLPIRHSLLPTAYSKDSYEHLFEDVIVMCMLGIEIHVAARADGDIGFFDPQFLDQLNEGRVFKPKGINSYVLIRFNDIVGKIFATVTRKPLGVTSSVAMAKHLNAKERVIVDALRNDDYLSVAVQKKNGKPVMMKLGLINQETPSTSELIRLIEAKDYADIELIKRDGRLVHIQSEEMVKL